MKKLICILGTTATGKTKLAVAVASFVNGEIISADSRQVYRGMDIGTGKDLEEYGSIPYHLIDIAQPGEEYNVFRYKRDFTEAFENIIEKGRQPVMCGGSGMYIDAVVNDYRLEEVPENPELRKKLQLFSDKELVNYLKKIRKLHNTTDITQRNRTIRAIEIEMFYQNERENLPEKAYDTMIFGIRFPREEIRNRITRRLEYRLNNGMIEEVEKLMKNGVEADKLRFYGLEYRYITNYIEGQLSYDEMFVKLNTAIHQFAKRQETWWRRMEKRGTVIHWIDGELSPENKTDLVLKKWKQSSKRY